MSFVAVAVAGGAIIGGAMQSSAAKKAAAGQTASTNASIEEQRRQFDLARSDLAPYREAGSAAVTRMRDLLGLSAPAGAAGTPRTIQDITAELRQSGRFTRPQQPQQFANEAEAMLSLAGITPPPVAQYDEAALNAEAQRLFQAQTPAGAAAGATTGGMSPEEVMKLDPGYQFRLAEGEKSLTNRLAAMGLKNSGAALKAGTRYAQDYATNAYDTIYNRLAGLAGTGQSATTTGAGLGANYAGNVGNLLTSGANARGAARIGQANAYSGALSTVGDYYAQNAYLDKILGARAGGGMSSTPYYGSYGGGNV